MTSLGKLLTIMNVVLSLTILAVALASFTNPVDFSDNSAKDGNPPGLFKQRAEQIRDAWEKIPGALASMKAAQKSLDDLKRYDEAHKWFARELAHLQSGNTQQKPIQVVKYNGALPEIDPANPDQVLLIAPMEAGQPLVLKSMQEYEADAARLAMELPKVEARHLAAIQKDIDETSKRLGESGLHQRLTAEEFKLAQTVEEIGRLQPLLINALVEGALIVQRRGALEARLDELKRLEKGSTVGRADR